MLLCAVTYQSSSILTPHAAPSSDFFGFRASELERKARGVHCRLHMRETVYFIRLSASRKSKSKSITPPSSIPNKDEQFGTCSSQTRSDDDCVVLPSDCGESESLKETDAEFVSSIPYTVMDFSHTLEPMAEQGSLLDKLKAVLLHVLASERWNASQLKLCDRDYLVSATNLIHYLALRCLDIGQLKDDLSSIGLLDLGTINPHVLASLTSCIKLLDNSNSDSVRSKEDVSFGISSQKLLARQKNENLLIQTMKRRSSSNEELLLGSLKDGRSAHIMVTVGQEVTQSDTLVTDLINAGASIFRINCAHGNPNLWSEIIKRVKENSQELEKPCRILMDLAGPKLRTGKMKPGPCVMKISPNKNAAGNVISPAQVWLSHRELGPPAHLSPDALLVLEDKEFLSKLEIGDTLRFRDARGKKRTLKISARFHVFSGAGYVAECSRTSYVESGTEFYMRGKKGKILMGRVVDVPALEPSIRLRTGDLLIISQANFSEQEELPVSKDGAYRITCSSGYLFDSVKPGERISFDDGKIWGVIQGTSNSEIVVSITHTGLRGTKLGSEKSINIPESKIRFEGLTSKDLMDLEFVSAHADIVGVSFIRNVTDIVRLRQELEQRKLQNLGVLLKIETKDGFKNLPFILLEAMKSSNPLGIMIARGDLAVECGWERLADMQEEILSLCGAAHVPVVWATQVLESLVKSGVPSRAEITDAAQGRRASCVMLNKGKHIVEAVSTLHNILHLNSTGKKAEAAELKRI